MGFDLTGLTRLMVRITVPGSTGIERYPPRHEIRLLITFHEDQKLVQHDEYLESRSTTASNPRQPRQKMEKDMKSLKKVHFDDLLEQSRCFLSADPPGIFVAEPLWRNEATETKMAPRYFSVPELDRRLNSLEPQPRQISSSPWQPVWW